MYDAYTPATVTPVIAYASVYIDRYLHVFAMLPTCLPTYELTYTCRNTYLEHADIRM